MGRETNFIIFNRDDQYSITECNNTGIKKAFLKQETVSGDRDVLLKLSRIVPVNESLRSFIERNSGRLICVYDNATALKL